MAALALVLAAAVYWLYYNPTIAAVSTTHPLLKDEQSSHVELEAPGWTVNQIEELLESAASALQDQKAIAFAKESPNSAGGLQTPCKWTSSIRKKDFDIPAKLLRGAFTSADFMRHEVLNPTDRPFCAQEIQQLDAMLSRMRLATAPVLLAASNAATKDRIEQIERGVVAAWEPAVTGADLRVRAGKVVRSLAARGTVITEDEAVKGLESGVYSSTSGPPSSAIRHKGKWYLHSQFGELPTYNAMWEALRHILIEITLLLFDWFVAHNFTSFTIRMTDILQQLSVAPSAQSLRR